MLGRQGDKASAAYIRGALAAKEPVVVMAAAESLAHMERGAANADLLALLRRSSDDQARQVGDILLWTTDEARLEPIAAALDTLSPSAKAAAVRVIGAKSGRRYAARVFALTSDSNPEVRTAAIGALAGVAGAGDLPALLRLLETTNDAALIDDVQKRCRGVGAPDDARRRGREGARRRDEDVGAPGAHHRGAARRWAARRRSPRSSSGSTRPTSRARRSAALWTGAAPRPPTGSSPSTRPESRPTATRRSTASSARSRRLRCPDEQTGAAGP